MRIEIKMSAKGVLHHYDKYTNTMPSSAQSPVGENCFNCKVEGAEIV
jgi:hypothetical protein